MLRVPGVFLLIVAFAGASELGRPVLTNHPPSAYLRSSQVWTAIQDDGGLMLFGNFSCTLLYDGEVWSDVDMPYARIVRSLGRGADGTIYVGAYNQLGYFRDDARGNKQFVSLVDQLPADERDFREIEAIATEGDRVYFATSTKLLCWAQGAFTVRAHRAGTPLVAAGALYFHARGEPLRRWADGEIRAVPGGDALRDQALAGLAAEPDGGLLVGTVTGGLMRLRNGHLETFSTEIDERLRRNRLRRLCRLADGSLALALESGGIWLLDSRGGYLSALNESNGLPNSVVHTLTPDREGGLWIGHNGGATRLEWPAAYTYFDKAAGLLGTGQKIDITRHAGQLHLATNSGVLRLQPGATGELARFVPVPGLAGETRAMAASPSGLLAVTERSVSLLENGAFHPVVTFPTPSANAPYAIVMSKRDPARAWIAQQEGLRSLRRTAAGWDDEGLVPGIDQAIYGVEELADGTLWLTKLFDGFKRVRFAATADGARGAAQIEDFSGGAGLPAKLAANNFVVPWRGEPLFSTDYGLFRRDATDRAFVPVQEFGPRLHEIPLHIARLVPSGEDAFWLVAFTTPPGPTVDRGRRIYRVPRAGEWETMPHFVIDNTGTVSRSGLLEETTPGGRVLWLAGISGLMRIELDRTAAAPVPFTARVKAEAQRPGESWWSDRPRPDLTDPREPPPRPVKFATPLQDGMTLAHGHTAVKFEYLAIRQQTGSAPHYQTWLEGYEDGWTVASSARTRIMTNLPAGDYVFHVRAEDSNGRPSEPALLRFRVLPPWWWTWWAFGGYGLGGGLLVFGLVRWRSRALHRQNAELEQTVQARTLTLRQREQQLSEARDAAEAANRAKSAFLASMSHELRTPLNAILGYTQLLRGSGELTAESRRQLEVIHQSGDHLAGMINEVLDLAKVEAGRIELSVQPFSLNRLLALLTEIFALRAAQKGLAFTLHTAPGVPDFVLGDEARLRQVLLNLLGNALKFTPQGHVELQVAATAGRISFAVSDTGIGIPPAEQSRIFDRFYQAAGPAFAAQGAGLGLAISQRLVRLMGGAIQVESAPGRGSTFRFELALPATGAAPAPLPERLPTGYRGPRLRVLIVDDEPINRDLLHTLLRPLGFLIDETDDGATAVERAAAQPPALILMDIRLKSLNGLDATRRIRALPMGGQIRIIAVTASVFPDDRAQAIAAGCDEFSEKPIQTARLIEMIGRLLQLDWIRPAESAGLRPSLLPEQLPAGWALPAPAVLEDLEALVEIGDLVAFRARVAAARSEPAAAHDLLDALHSLAAQARLADLRRWLEAARRRLSPS
ncbi:MAG TPA: ATP-binding protein [Lacunisphaera sp.]